MPLKETRPPTSQRRDRRNLNKKMEHLFGTMGASGIRGLLPTKSCARGFEERIEQAGSSIDLKTGWDLSKAEDRKDMWRTLKKEKPSLLVLCPPCHGFSVLQELNFERMGLEKSVAMIQAGLEHLELAAALAKWQIRRGGYAVLEQPLGARSWKEEVSSTPAAASRSSKSEV